MSEAAGANNLFKNPRRHIQISLEVKLASTFTSVMAFEVDTQFTVQELLNYLEKRQDFVKFSRDQVLRYRGRVLSPESLSTLAQLGISDGARLIHTRQPLIKKNNGLLSFGLGSQLTAQSDSTLAKL